MTDPSAPTNRPESPGPVVLLLESLGLRTTLAPDGFCPPVDRELIIAYVERDVSLTIDEKETVLRLSARFRPWREALTDALIDWADRGRTVSAG